MLLFSFIILTSTISFFSINNLFVIWSLCISNADVIAVVCMVVIVVVVELLSFCSAAAMLSAVIDNLVSRIPIQ